MIFFFIYYLATSTASFGPLSERQPHSPNTDHPHLPDINFQPKSQQ